MRSLLKDISYFFVKVDAFALSKEWLLLLFIATLEARIESYEVKLFRGLNSPPEDIHHTTASLAILYYFILLHFSTVPRVTANHFLSPAPPSFTFFKKRKILEDSWDAAGPNRNCRGNENMIQSD